MLRFFTASALIISIFINVIILIINFENLYNTGRKKKIGKEYGGVVAGRGWVGIIGSNGIERVFFFIQNCQFLAVRNGIKVWDKTKIEFKTTHENSLQMIHYYYSCFCVGGCLGGEGGS